MEPKGSDATPGERDVRLSNAQKRDLLGMSAAAMITTALIAAPMLLPRGSASPLLVDPTVLTAEAVPTPLLIQTLGTRPAELTPVRTAAVVSVKRHRDRATAASSPVRLVGRPLPASAPVLVAVNTSVPRASKPLGKRLAGLFTGDGTYSVRPFPTVSTERQ